MLAVGGPTGYRSQKTPAAHGRPIPEALGGGERTGPGSRGQPMIEDQFFERIDPLLREFGALPEDGEEFRTPALDVLRYYYRPMRLHWAPFFGRGLSVVAVARQPVDVELSVDGYRTLLTRVAMAANGRFPVTFANGVALGLTVVSLTPEPIGPGDDAVLRAVVNGRPLPRLRAVPLGVIRVNLGQEALSFALASGPVGAFPEPIALADALTPHFRRFVPLLEV